MTIRSPAVAGAFYPGDRAGLLAALDGCLGAPAAAPTRAVAVIVPHAGWIYSGGVAGSVFSRVVVPDRALLVGPKHRRAGANAAIAAADAWRFPFGEVAIDRRLADAVAAHTAAEPDDLAHREEHSLEVEVPFLWRRNPGVRFAALALGLHRPEALEELGKGLAAAIREAGGDVLLVASTDMSHQLPVDEARELDQLALARVLELDPDGLYDAVFDNDISMCGVIPTTAVLHAARELGARTAELVRYAHSGEINGDTRAVVGYAGIVIR